MMILSWFWPPLAWRIMVQRWDAEDRASRSAFYRDVYIPWLKADAQRRLREFYEPSAFLRLVRRTAT